MQNDNFWKRTTFETQFKICFCFPVKPVNSVFVFRSNLLYNGHLVIADIFFNEPAKSWSNSYRKNIYIADTFVADICYSGHFFWAQCEHFGQSLPLNSGHPMISWEKRKHRHVFIRQISVLYYLIFPNYFSPML